MWNDDENLRVCAVCKNLRTCVEYVFGEQRYEKAGNSHIIKAENNLTVCEQCKDKINARVRSMLHYDFGV